MSGDGQPPLTALRGSDGARHRVRGLFFGWWIVLAAAATQLLQSSLLLQAYGAYVAVLQEEFGWSKTALAGAFSLQRVESGLLGPIHGWMLQRWGPRRVVRVGVVVLGLGFVLFSQIDSLATFYLTFLVMAIGASLSGYMSMTATIVHWFERRRATAMGITQVGGSVGGLLVPLVAWSLVELGWRTTAFLSGLAVILLGLPLAQLLRSAPEEYGYGPDGVPLARATAAAREPAGADPPAPSAPDFTPRQALRTRAFWFISLGHGLAVTVISAVMVHLVVHLNEGLGLAVTDAAVVVAFMTAMTIVGQFIGGILGDRFEKRLIATVAMFGHAGALLLLAWGDALGWVIGFAVLHGLAAGVRGPLMQAIRADYFGRRSFAMIMGFSSMIVMGGMMVGPLVAGVLADRFGSYRSGFTVLALLAALGSLFFVFGRRPPPPATQPAP